MALTVGQRVVVRDAFNRLHRAVVAAVPRDWRDRSMSATYTTRGDFPKVWAQIASRASVPVPWPAEDVFTDLGEAQMAVRCNQRDGTA